MQTMSFIGDRDKGAFCFQMPYLLRDMGAILLPLHKVLELFLHLLSIPRPMMFGFVYQGGIRSPLFHAQDNPLTKHYLDDHILFFFFFSYQHIRTLRSRQRATPSQQSLDPKDPKGFATLLQQDPCKVADSNLKTGLTFSTSKPLLPNNCSKLLPLEGETLCGSALLLLL